MEKSSVLPVNVLYYNSSLALGGTDVYMVNLIKNMDKSKFKFHVLIKQSDGVNENLKNDLENIGVQIDFLGTSLFSQISNAIKFFKNHKGEFQVFHINATSGAVGIFAYLGKKYGKIEKIIFHSHMGGNDNKNNITDKIGIKMAKKYSYKLATCSDFAGKFMYGEDFCKTHEVVVLNNSIDLDKFKFDEKVRGEYREKLGLEDSFVILNVGRCIPQKNQKKLIEIFAEVLKKDNSARLVIVGVGYLFEELTERARSLGVEDKILFLGERNDVNKIMQSSDVFVMTSIHEGLPIVAVEAQSSGLQLVLSTNITTSTDITGNCKFVELSESNEAWADEILQAKTKERVDVSDKIKANHFDNESSMKIIEKLYLGEEL